MDWNSFDVGDSSVEGESTSGTRCVWMNVRISSLASSMYSRCLKFLPPAGLLVDEEESLLDDDGARDCRPPTEEWMDDDRRFVELSSVRRQR